MLLRLIKPQLIEEIGNGGRIVNISSLGGITGVTAKGGCAHYGTAKHALSGLTKIMALEYAPNKIRINAIAPTVIETDLVRKYKESAVDKDQAAAILAGTNPLIGPGIQFNLELKITLLQVILCLKFPM